MAETSTAKDKAAEAQPQAPPLALRPREAARARGIGVRKLWELTNRGLLPHVKVGRCVVYPVDLLREWLAQQAKGGR